MKQVNRITSVLALVALFAAASVTFGKSLGTGHTHTTAQFQGPKANTGTATHSLENGASILRVSEDFKVPDTPAPTWRVVDSKGNVYTLDAFQTKAGEKREVTVPPYVHNIIKVQVYCAFAQVLLGEASFTSPAR